jgi:hypothetical protein
MHSKLNSIPDPITDAAQDFNTICDPDFEIYSAQLIYHPPFTHSSSDPEPEIITDLFIESILIQENPNELNLLLTGRAP